MENEHFTLLNNTKSPIPTLPFEEMKDAALGKKYSLSLVFVGNKKSQELNRTYRDKDKPTNILSFTLDKENGEIFIAPLVAKKEAPEFGRTFDNFIAFLFIHGLMHLKGMDHGSTMERAEEKLRKKFGV